MDIELEAVPVTIGYRVGVVLVAVATVALVLVYVSLIGGVAWLAYLHVRDPERLLHGRGNELAALMVYLGGVVAAAVLIFFLIKPVLARRARADASMPVSVEEAPALHALIEDVRRAVKAPRAVEVRVDSNVNASASFRRGLWSLLSRKLIITVGLPLLHGLTARQLAGILAHELGHFAQGHSLFLTYLIRTVNGWFARVVYERDAWDARLASTADLQWRLALAFGIIRVIVWLTRQVLKVLMHLGHAISSYLMRQMEYDADRYEARLVGSVEFTRTARRMRAMTAGYQQALGLLSDSWKNRQLCDDLPVLIVAMTDRLPAEVLAVVEELHRSGKTSYFDTHPPDAARIARAEREGERGMLVLEGPATGLIADLVAVGRRATLAQYQVMVNATVAPSHLVPVEAFMRSVDQAGAVRRAKAEFLGDYFSPLHPLALPIELPAPALTVEQARARAAASAETLRRLQDPPARPPAKFWMAPAHWREAQEAAAGRLVSSLSLLRLPGGSAERHDEVNRLLASAFLIADQAPALVALCAAADDAGDALGQLGPDDRETRQAVMTVETHLTAVEAGLRRVPSEAAVYLAGLPACSYSDPRVLVLVQHLVQRLHDRYDEILQRLVQLALELERAEQT